MTLLLLLLLAQNVNPPGHSESHKHHRTYKGGEVHEIETDGVTDGIVFWKNGTCQAMHNGVLGQWCPATYKREGPMRFANGDKAAVAQEAVTTPPNDNPAVIIDDYAYISPEQVSAWGGMTGAINQVQLAVDVMNDSFTNAGVNAQQRLVGVAQYDVNQGADWATTFSAFVTRYQSGAFASLRTSSGFDTITLFVTHGEYCGQAYVFYSALPLHVVNGSCAAGNRSYAHEAGHTMGLCHNWGDASCTPPPVCGPTAVGYGSSAFRTPMSYTGGPRTSQYSAPPPAVWYSDHTSAVGIAGQTDATACLKLTVATVAGWHTTAIAVPTHTAPTTLLWAPPTHAAPAGLSWVPQ